MTSLISRRGALFGIVGASAASALAVVALPAMAAAAPGDPVEAALDQAQRALDAARAAHRASTPTGVASVTPAATATVVPTLIPPTVVSTASPTAAPVGFVRIAGRTLTRDGTALKLKGASTYRGGAWSGANERGRIDADLAMAQAANLNTIRLVDFLQGNGGPSGYVADVYAPQIYANIDLLLAGAEARGMLVIFDLSSFRNRLERAGKMPYNPADWQQYLDFIGARYKNSRAIAYYALAGEPAPPNGSDPLRPTTAGLTNFFAQASARLKAADPNHLISAGGLLQLDWNSGIDWRAIFALPPIRHANLHVYGAGDLAYAPTVGAWAASQGIPFFVEEFGANQNANSDQQRADYFKARFALARAQQAAVATFWDLGPAVGGDTYDVNPNTPLTYAAVRDATL